MALITLTRNYHDGEVYTQAEIDAPYDDIETFLNITGIDDQNIQNAGITASQKLAAGSVSTANLGALVVTAAKIATNTVTGGTTGSGNLAVGTVTGGTAGNLAATTITEANMAPLSVGTPELILGSVTPAILSFTQFPTTQYTYGSNQNIPLGAGLVYADTSAGAWTATLYAAASNTGPITFKKTTSDLNALTITDGAGFTTTLNTQGETVTVEADSGPAWNVLARHANTALVPYTPTITGWTTTNTNYLLNTFAQRRGKNLRTFGSFTGGNVSGGVSLANLTIGFNGTDQPTGLTMDSAFIYSGVNMAIGIWGSENSIGGQMFANTNGSAVTVYFGARTGTGSGSLAGATAGELGGAGNAIRFMFEVPITGWND